MIQIYKKRMTEPARSERATAFALVAAPPRTRVDSEKSTRKNGDGVAGTAFVAIDPESTALVACAPLTGRTHQIRAHLKHLGHPIANDVRYGGAAERDGEKTTAMLATCRATRANALLESQKKNVSPEVETNAPEREWPLCPHCPMMAHGANDAAEGDAGGSGARAEDLERLYLHCAEYRATFGVCLPDAELVPEDIADEAALRFSTIVSLATTSADASGSGVTYVLL